MRVLAAFIGVVLEVVTGVVIALLAAVVLTRNDPFGVTFIDLLLSPVGGVMSGIPARSSDSTPLRLTGNVELLG